MSAVDLLPVKPAPVGHGVLREAPDGDTVQVDVHPLLGVHLVLQLPQVLLLLLPLLKLELVAQLGRNSPFSLLLLPLLLVRIPLVRTEVALLPVLLYYWISVIGRSSTISRVASLCFLPLLPRISVIGINVLP